MPAYFKYIHKNCYTYKQEKMDTCTLDHTNEEYMQAILNTADCDVSSKICYFII